MLSVLLFLIFAAWTAIGVDGVFRGIQHSEPYTFWVGAGLAATGIVSETIFILTTH